LALREAFGLIPSGGYTFEQFVEDFARNYGRGTQEYAKRKAIFEKRLESILLHNADLSTTWQRGINRFADLAPDEFAASGHLGYNKALARAYAASESLPKSGSLYVRNSNDSLAHLPKSFDWRNKGVISNVKDQGHCGSCWAFATAETVESHAAIATGLLPVLSTQQLVSCAPNPLTCGGVGGCEGSIPEVAYNYIQLYGMTTEWMMPYSSYYGSQAKCGFNTSRSVVTISGYQKLPPNDYAAVMATLVSVGPLAINVQADTWSDYEKGVFDGCKNYNNVDIDHVVQLVGYGTDSQGGDYWLVRNSWDVTWGEAGYIRLKRSSSPSCGDDISPLDGTGCAGGPAKQHVCGTCGMLFDVSYPLGAAVPKRGHHTIVV
jgi:cathepsin L